MLFLLTSLVTRLALGSISMQRAAALQGQVYNPNLGFATIKNVEGKPTYPYDPFYWGLSPRLAVAWNPTYSDGILGAIFGASAP